MGMQVLTDERWKKFKSDGKLFEELICELLSAMYPNADFSHTSWSHDGGKDFEYGFPFFDEKLKVWAECKYHQKALPIHDVSMTLFMAYVESASVVLFFSYSPVNSEFQKYIDLYKKKSEKTVKIFADTSLEEQILKYRDKIKFTQYFGEQDVHGTVNTGKAAYKFWVQECPKGIGSYYTLHLNDVVRLELSIMNPTSKQIDVLIDVPQNETSSCFEILDKRFVDNDYKAHIQICPYGIGGMSFPMKLTRYKAKLRFPSIKVSCNGEKKTLRIAKPVVCRWLAETELKGKKYLKILNEEKVLLHGLKANFCMLAGRSGTGKSRLIKEICDAATSLDYQCIHIDADEKKSLTASDFFKKLISILEDIPELPKSSRKKTQYLYERTQNRTVEEQFAIQLLFESSIEFDTIKKELVNYLHHAFSKSRYLLALDNIQFYDEAILEVLQEILGTDITSLRSTFIFSANLDYVYRDTGADRLVHRMEWLNQKNPSQYLYYEITGFEKAAAIDYLQTCLGINLTKPSSDSFPYDISINKIIETYGTNPFYLQNYLLYLLQKEIICRTETTSFYILDCVQFQDSIQNVPKQIINLLSHREAIFIDRFIKDEQLYQKYCSLVSYLAFCKWLPRQMINGLVAMPDDILCSLLDLGILKTNDDGCIGFFHQQIEQYYCLKYPFTDLTENELRAFNHIAKKQSNRKHYLESIFLAQYLLNEVEPSVFKDIIKRIQKQEVNFDKTLHLCTGISILLENEIFILPPKTYIEIYEKMTNLCISRVGILSTQKLFESLYSNFLENYCKYKMCLTDVLRVLSTYLRECLNLHMVELSLKKNQELVSLLKNHFSQHPDYAALLISLYHIQIFAYNSLNDLERALNVSDMAINLAEKLSDKTLLIKSLIAKGDTYYTNVTSSLHQCDIVDCWSQAEIIYNSQNMNPNHSHSSLALWLNILMRSLLSDLFCENLKKAEEKAKSLSNYFSKTQMFYFEIKIRQLYVIYCLLAEENDVFSEESYQYYENLVKQSVDICAVYGNETLYFDCFHLLAILQRYYGKTSLFLDTYKKTYSILLKIQERQQSLERWSYFLLDMTIAMYEANAKDLLPPYLQRMLDINNPVADILGQLQTASTDRWQDIVEDTEALSIPCRPDKHVYFPKI